ncbi:MAG: hypothetical protein NUV57_00825, partial [archaeon]|nr:hypothetical protein [archaeon]
MGLSEQIGGVYTAMEDKFFGLMDFISDKGIPVYSVLDPLEERGIPAFPVAIFGILAILFLAYGFLFLSSAETVVSLNITDNTNATLSGVSITFTDEASGKKIEIGSVSFRDGQIIKIPRGIGSKIILDASKEGHELFTSRFVIDKAEKTVSIQLKKIVAYTEGAIRLVDIETGDLIQGAELSALIADQAGVECFEGARGIYTCPGVIIGEDTTLTIEHPNYEQKILDTSFLSDEISEIKLVPKAGASLGKSNLIVRIFDFETQQRLGNFTMRVFDSKDNEIITELVETDNDGEQVTKISKGTSVRIVIEKENYITYDSSILEENITLRNEEEIREVYLKPGQNALTVGVIDVTGRPLTSMDVFLFNSLGELLNNKTTSLAGEVVFENLSPEEVYFVSAWDEKFVPAREAISLNEKNNITLVMQRATADNSGSLTVYTTDDQSNAINDATLNFLEETEAGLIPLGIPPQKTDSTGKFSFLAPLNSTLVINATKGLLEGQDTKSILQTFENESFIVMIRPFSQVSLTVLDEQGKEIDSGFVTIIAGTDLLFEGEYTKGGISFDPKENSYVKVAVTDNEGNVFEEEIFVAELEKVSVSPQGKSGPTTNPELEFLGVFNIDGSPANGLAKGIDYFLKFRAVYIEGATENGLHVRLGDDNVRFADSQDAGIIGYSASGGKAFYGRSYSPEPSPGFEALDYDNKGEEGKYNKFVEITFETGGEKIIKVRAKAKETASVPDILLSYRAWSKISNIIYRTPADPELGIDVFSSNKTSLYSETGKDRIKILEQSASCKNELCASYKFIRSDGSEFSPENFEAIIGEVYALEVNLSPDKASEVTVKASTQRQKPKIGFQGFGINDFANFIDTNSTDTAIQVENVSALEGETTSVRIFFKPYITENSQIVLQLISGETILNEQFNFEIYEERNIVMKTIPGNVVLGEDFVIILNDSAGNQIENAEIKLSSEAGEHLETIQGDASTNKGGNGRYSVKNSFDAGMLLFEVSAKRFKPLKGAIEITKEGVIAFTEDEAFITIRKGQTIAEQFIEIQNLSKQGVEQLSFEVVPIGVLPQGMDIQVTPVSVLGPNSSQRLVVQAEYIGDKETSQGEARIIVRGRTQTGFSVSAETKIKVEFNPKIDSACIEFSKKKLAVYVASGLEDRGYYDATYGTLPPNQSTNYYTYNNFTTTSSTSFTAKLAEKPECQGFEMELVPEIIAGNKKAEQGLEVEAETIRLTPELTNSDGRRKDVDEVIVSITNKIIRNYPGKEMFKFDLVFKTDGYEKSIPLEVYIWNPRYALQVTRNIELFLGPDQQGRLSAQVPLFVRNIGEADIEDVRFRIVDTKGTGNVDITVVPDIPIQFLRKGQAIQPPYTLVAQVLRNEKTTLLEVKELDISGVIDGQTFSFGPVIITAHASSDQCLTVTPANINFQSPKSSEGALSREITLRNTCAEEVRVVDLSEVSLGNNKLRLTPLNTFIPPGGQSKFTLVLEKNEDYQGTPVQVFVKGFLPRSGTPINSSPIIVDVQLGQNINAGEAAADPREIPVCGTNTTKTVRFPILADNSAPQCDNSYCDAVQLAKYLTNRIEQKIKDAEKQIQTQQGDSHSLNCTSQENLAKGYCNFDEMGLASENFYVYMSHDTLTPQLLEKEFKTRQSSIKNYTSDFTQGDNAGGLLGGYSKQVFMNSNFSGCGRYSVTLNGSARVQSGRVLPELMNVVIDLTPDDDKDVKVRQVTEQCEARIQNVSNFLPLDEGVNVSQSGKPWIGVVETNEPTLENIGKEVAKKIFNKEERFTKGSSGTNQLNLAFGQDEGYLVKLEMDKVPLESPYKITAAIKESIGQDETVQSAIAKEAAEAISGLRENAIDGCIAEDESYFLIKGSMDIGGKLSLTTPDKISVNFENAQCAEVIVSSQVKENVILRGKQSEEISGVTKDSPFFRTTEENDNSNQNPITIQVSELDNKKNIFTGKTNVCVTGDSQLQNAQGKIIVVEVLRSEGSQKPDDTKEVGLEVCGIHPLDFMEKIQTKEPNTDNYYYATFGWKGDPSSINFRQFETINDVQSTVAKIKELKENPRGIQQGDSAEEISAKTKAGYWYVGTCSVVSGATSALRPIVGWGTGIFNLIFDCWLPYAALMGREIPVLSDIINNVQPIVDEILGVVGDAIEYISGQLGAGARWLLTAMGVDGVNPNAETTQQYIAEFGQQPVSQQFTDTLALSVLIKDSFVARSQTFGAAAFDDFSLIGKGAQYVPGYMSKARVVGQNVSNEIIKDVKKNVFSGVRDSAVDDFTDALSSKLGKNIEASISAAAKSKSSLGRGGVLTSEELSEAIQNAIDKTSGDADVLKKFNGARAKINTPAGKTPIIDKTRFADEIAEEIRGKANIGELPAIPDDKTYGGTAQPNTRTLQTRVKNARDRLVNESVEKFRAETGTKVPTSII